MESEFKLLLENTPLFDWSENSHVRFFSGTATYTNTFNINGIPKKTTQVILQLGEVKEIAEIMINRKLAFDPKLLRENEENSIQIKVTNLLMNKIIGFEHKKIKWRSDYLFVNQHYKKFAPTSKEFLPSGLIGPVNILF